MDADCGPNAVINDTCKFQLTEESRVRIRMLHHSVVGYRIIGTVWKSIENAQAEPLAGEALILDERDGPAGAVEYEIRIQVIIPYAAPDN